MKTCIIINPNAGSAEQMEALQDGLEAQGSTCWKTDHEGHAVELAEQAVEEGYECVAAAGGDGTLNEVVNGLMQAGGKAMLGLVPLGTGNDLARTLGIPLDVEDALDVLAAGQTAPLDLICVEMKNETIYAANASSGGFSDTIGDAMSSELKSTWGPLAYVFGAAAALDDWQNYETRITFDDEAAEQVRAFNVFIMNGQTVAGGKEVAPMADPSDGMLDVVVAEGHSRLDVAALAARYVTGTHLDSPDVLHRRVRSLRVISKPSMRFNVDGEALGDTPVSFSIVPSALTVVRGSVKRST